MTEAEQREYIGMAESSYFFVEASAVTEPSNHRAHRNGRHPASWPNGCCSTHSTPRWSNTLSGPRVVLEIASSQTSPMLTASIAPARTRSSASALLRLALSPVAKRATLDNDYSLSTADVDARIASYVDEKLAEDSLQLANIHQQHRTSLSSSFFASYHVDPV